MKVRFGWLVAMLVMGLSLVGCPPIEEIPEVVLPDISDGEIPTEEVPDTDIFPDKPEEAPHVEPFWVNYEVQATFFDEEGLPVGEPEEISLMGFIPSENGPVQLDFTSTEQFYFSSIQVEYRLKNGDYDYLNILSDWGFSLGKADEKSTPFWYDEEPECSEESVAHILVPFSEEILNAKVSVSWYYTANPNGTQEFVFTLLSSDDLDQDHLPDAWEEQYSCFSAENQDENPERYGRYGYADGDGLSNQDEMAHGTDPCLADTDGDGFDDDDEIWGGWRTDPLDAEDHPPVQEEGESGKG